MADVVVMEPLGAGDPRRVGDYRLLGKLGEGGMGRVYLGRSRGGRLVAVKVVAPALTGDVQFRRRFSDEVAAARRVGGFYTAHLVDADTEATPPWFVTAYIAGPSLHQAVGAHGPLPYEAVRVLGSGLAEGLAAVHGCGLIHRDLKPGNVLLAHDGPRVIDFGISRALDAVQQSHTVIGTPGFMSPEQVRGDGITPASDVFSLGCVLAYAATGRSPFSAARVEAFYYRVLHGLPDLDDLPPGLGPLIGACLEREPEDRPGLAEILEHLEVPEEQPDWLPGQVMEMIAERRQATRLLPAGPTAAPGEGGASRVRRTSLAAAGATGFAALGAAILWSVLPAHGSGSAGSGPVSGTGTSSTHTVSSSVTYSADGNPCDVIDNEIISDFQLISTGTPGGYTAGSATVKTCAWQSAAYGDATDTFTLAYTSSRVDLAPSPQQTSPDGYVAPFLRSVPSAAVYTSADGTSCEVVWPTSTGDVVTMETLDSMTGPGCVGAAKLANAVYPRVPH